MANITLPNGCTTDELRADVAAYCQRGGRYDFAFTPDTIMALLDVIDRQQSALSAIAEIARTDGGAELKDAPVAAWDKVLKLASGGAEVSE